MNKGFSLLETMIAIGISTGIALVVYKVIGESEKRITFIETRDEISQVHRELVGYFTNRYTCTNTIKRSELDGIINQDGIAFFNFPHRLGKVTVESLKILNQTPSLIEMQATYSYMQAGNRQSISRNFRLEASYEGGVFDSCISRGSLGIDPKEACDLVAGYNADDESYFKNGKCQYAMASCEQSGRVWDTVTQKCHFSTEDLEALRIEICNTLGFEKYDPVTSKCVVSQSVIEATKKIFGQ